MLKTNSSHSKDYKNLNEWLFYLETIHTAEIDLGLTRIAQVAARLKIDLSFATVITVAGTNGKGTTCTFLENTFLHKSVSKQIQSNEKLNSLFGVAVYSSPHIKSFNERLRINKQNVTNELLIEAFELIELTRAEISLSYYEFTTLAAFLVLMKIKPNIIILEVGLGGRLDATNIIDADVAVVTTVDIDHQAFLGNDRETIGFEKAGIMRAEQIIVVGDTDAPKSVLNFANKVAGKNSRCDGQGTNEKLRIRDKDFTLQEAENNLWRWQSEKTVFTELSPCFIPRDNVATALMVLVELGINLNGTLVNQIISETKVAGRTELFTASHNENFSINCDVMLDVAHNPQAARYLAKQLTLFKQESNYNKVHAVVAMLADKDIENSLLSLKGAINSWYVGQLDVPRASSSELLKEKIESFTNSVICFDNISQAFKIANQQAKSDDLILVFGSFFTVAEIRDLIT